MESVSVSQFKARCLALLQHVHQSRQPLRVTRFGVPLADVIPAHTTEGARRGVGSMQGTFRIVGDIIAPVAAPGDWKAHRGEWMPIRPAAGQQRAGKQRASKR